MRRGLSLSVCVLAGYLIAVQLTHASGSIVVDESKTVLTFLKGQVNISLAVTNSTGKSFRGRIRLQIVDPSDIVRATYEADAVVRKGSSRLNCPMDFNAAQLRWDEQRGLPLYRIKYSLSGSDSSHEASEGIIALSQIASGLYEVVVTSPEKVNAGATVRAQIRTVNAVTARPVKGVKLHAELVGPGDHGTVASKTGISGENGWATFDLNLPKDVGDTDDFDIRVVAGDEPLTVSTSDHIEIDKGLHAIVTTDKPIYQPGQILHVRAMVFNKSKQALVNQRVEFEISDPDSTTVYKVEATTTRYGIASIDWPVPASSKLGPYTIELNVDGFDSGWALPAQVRISRYDLPNFSVSVKPDRPYYQHGQNAQVTVKADYLFGQPVKGGHVRIVQENERSWNSERQRYDITEGQVHEGEAKDDGTFTATLDLTDAFIDLRDSDYQRFRDLTFAAYYTDPTTNRTEQRRFDIRLTRDPIHVYVVFKEGDQSKNLPLRFYVSTTYADGQPAECKLELSAGDPGTSRFVRRTVKTNKLGVAKVFDFRLPKEWDTGYSAELSLVAKDRQGRTGAQKSSIWLRSGGVVHVDTPKSVFGPGENISVNLEISENSSYVILDVVRNSLVLKSERLKVSGGRAQTLIPYDKRFKGDLTLYATAFATDDDDDTFAGQKQIIFPYDDELKLNVKTDRPEYQPGQDAHAVFDVEDAQGRAASSALGVVVIDRAVEERARTDADFSTAGNFAYACSFLYGNGNVVAGLTRRDLNKLDLSKPISPEVDLAAEMILWDNREYYSPNRFTSSHFSTNARSAYSDLIDKQLKRSKWTLDWLYLLTGHYQRDSKTLYADLASRGIDFRSFKDPWGNPYAVSFWISGPNDIVKVTSAGPDKKHDTPDDIEAFTRSRAYFQPFAYYVTKAVNEYHARTGGFIRDRETLVEELKQSDIDLDSLRDGWDRPYYVTFGVVERNYTLDIYSKGPDGKRDYGSRSDDVMIQRASIDYFAEIEATINEAVGKFMSEHKRLPHTEAEFTLALKSEGLNWDEIKDPWGHKYRFSYSNFSRYADRVEIINAASFGSNEVQQKTKITPVTQTVGQILIMSDGDTARHSYFYATKVSHIESEQSAADLVPTAPKVQTIALSGALGAITGTVRDMNDAVIPNAKVTAKNLSTELIFEAVTNDEGVYLLRNLPAGKYEIRIDATGFKPMFFVDVPVQYTSLTKLDAVLSVGATTETVEISGAVDTSINATSSLMSVTTKSSVILVKTKPNTPVLLQQIATPRLRQYFPETLVWQPSIETDSKGRGKIDFKIADNITTWKMAVIASTEDGRVGYAEKDIRAFQPFFADHEPPKILTVGDELSLPVTLRNYLDRALDVDVKMQPENWFAFSGKAENRVRVPAGDSKNQVFPFRTTLAVRDGKQRVTAVAPGAGDAIEKPVSVHPDGEEIAKTSSTVLRGKGTLETVLPADMISGSINGELKIYPNLLAHVTESIEGIIRRPYGCGEQTISSTYPNLMALRYFDATGKDSAIAEKARKYLHDGYERLLNYQAPDGSFSYWGGSSPADLALTAYALRFLSDARSHLEVDEDVIKKTREFLIRSQNSDGHWPAKHYWEKTEDRRRSSLLTAYITRALAETGPGNDKAGSEEKAIQTAIERGLAITASRAGEIDEPYLIASYALTCFAAGQKDKAVSAVEKLKGMALNELDTSYWDLQTNTPFYGWGLAGRLETTALVVQAMARMDSPEYQNSVNRGLLFILKQKDRYGVWYSTQATINVLEAIRAVVQGSTPQTSSAGGAQTAEIIVNGRPATTVTIPSEKEISNPIYVDVSSFLSPGENHIEILRPNGASAASAQLVTTYYIPWTSSEASTNEARRVNGATALKLKAQFDRTETNITGEISCRVEAERVGFSGYGMMLAEIGLPPGADVNRESIKKAMESAGWGISQYDILPDRVVFYLWPQAGGVKFDFKFRPRFAMNAKSAPSVLYDYYNPEARTVVAPRSFVITP